MKALCFFLGSAIAAVSTAAAKEQVLEGGSTRPQLLELYTSEGCSSCPPAEQWMSERLEDPKLWTAFLPLVFHVNYWDRLGWRDVYSSNDYTARQYAYAAQWGSPNVYTPCFVRDGREWRPSSEGLRAAPAQGKLTVSVSDRLALRARFSSSSQLPQTLDVWVALTESGIDSQVRAGENAGRKLRHDFTVVQLSRKVLQPSSTVLSASDFDLPAPPAKTNTRRAVVVWVSPANDTTTILAAVGGWIDG